MQDLVDSQKTNKAFERHKRERTLARLFDQIITAEVVFGHVADGSLLRKVRFTVTVVVSVCNDPWFWQLGNALRSICWFVEVDKLKGCALVHCHRKLPQWEAAVQPANGYSTRR